MINDDLESSRVKINFSFFLLILLTNNLVGQSKVPVETGSKVTQQEAQLTLEYHNGIRAEFSSPPLRWSTDLATYAQEWADWLAVEIEERGEIRHRPKNLRKGKDFGENIFYGWGGAFSPLDASEAWYNEIENYKYAPISFEANEGTGHFTQMIWKTSKFVGIGVARFGKNVIIVANYDPPGNVIGEKPY